MSKENIKTNLKGTDKIELKYNDREVDMTLTDFKTYLDEVLEPEGAVLIANEPLRYKALLSQNAPIATTNTVVMVAGQIWDLDQTVTDPGSTGKLDTLELISGVLYQIGSKYRSSIDQTIFFILGDNMSYDGSPYVVSTDINGDLNPFVNTIGVISFNYSGSTGAFYILFPDLIDINKTSVNIIGNGDAVSGNGSYYIDAIDKTSTPYYYYFSTRNNITDLLDDNLMQFDKIEIEVYP